MSAVEGSFNYGNFTLDASRSSAVYGASSTVQVSAIFGQYLIRYC